MQITLDMLYTWKHLISEFVYKLSPGHLVKVKLFATSVWCNFNAFVKCGIINTSLNMFLVTGTNTV